MPQNFISIDEKRRNTSFLVVTMAMFAVFSMPTAAHAWIFGLRDTVLKLLQHPALWNAVAMWNTVVVLSLLAGLASQARSTARTEMAPMSNWSFLALDCCSRRGWADAESYVDHAATASVSRIALSTTVSYAGNVLLPMFVLTQFGARALHRQNAWTRKLMVGGRSVMVSGILHYGQTTIIQTHGL